MKSWQTSNKGTLERNEGYHWHDQGAILGDKNERGPGRERKKERETNCHRRAAGEVGNKRSKE